MQDVYAASAQGMVDHGSVIPSPASAAQHEPYVERWGYLAPLPIRRSFRVNRALVAGLLAGLLGGGLLSGVLGGGPAGGAQGAYGNLPPQGSHVGSGGLGSLMSILGGLGGRPGSQPRSAGGGGLGSLLGGGGMGSLLGGLFGGR